MYTYCTLNPNKKWYENSLSMVKLIIRITRIIKVIWFKFVIPSFILIATLNLNKVVIPSFILIATLNLNNQKIIKDCYKLSYILEELGRSKNFNY